jgi:hypothetical protein
MGSASSNGKGGIAFLVAAGIAYEIVAAINSSPQTTEINSKARSGTLMKWVHLAMAQAIVFILLAALLDVDHAPHILFGGFLALGLMYGQYVHAKNAGLRSTLPGTEQY